MTLDEFKTQILTKAQRESYSEEEIEKLHLMSVNFFNLFFNKWKKEKFSVPIS